MKKNILKYGIVSIMAFVFTLRMGAFPISASEQNTSNNTFYVETEYVPDEAIDYAVDNVFDYLVARSSEESFELNDLTMGSPFSMGKESADENESRAHFCVHEFKKACKM